jgi:crossover junction endodeoxyribonuclease RusA
MAGGGIMIKIVLPDIPPSLNKWSRMHWATAAKIKKQWEHDILYTFLTSTQIIPKEEKQFPWIKAKIRIIYYFKTRARRDIDNMNQKFLLDGLVKAGVISDDSTNVIGQVEIIPAYDKNNPRTEIEVLKEG